MSVRKAALCVASGHARKRSDGRREKAPDLITRLDEVTEALACVLTTGTTFFGDKFI